MPKRFILNAENFGQSKESNRAMLEGYNNGFLTSAGICVNGNSFESAVNEILPECPNLSIGIMLNLTRGMALTKNEHLTNSKNRFKFGFLRLLTKCGDRDFMLEVEKEFRCQIEILLQHTKIDYINSVNNIHLIPPIFDLVLNLAKEYNIPFVSTKYEEGYYVANILKHLNFKYPKNILKTFLLNGLTKRNLQKLEGKNIKTNRYFVGGIYSSMINSEVIKSGLEAIEDEGDFIVEIGISPCVYKKFKRKKSFEEFMITINKELLDSIERMGYEAVNYKKLRV